MVGKFRNAKESAVMTKRETATVPTQPVRMVFHKP